LDFPYFLAKRITLAGRRTFSKLIVRVTIGALALAIAAILLSVAILNGFKSEIIERQRGFFGDIAIAKNDLNASYENTPISLSPAQAEAIRNLPEVKSIAPFATKAGIMNVNGEVEGVLLKGINDRYGQHLLHRTIVRGDTLDFSREDSRTQILVSEYLAKRLHLDVGDKFVMFFIGGAAQRRARPFTVRGIYTTHSAELDKTYVIGSLDLIRRLNDLGEDEAGGYEVRIASFAALEGVTSAVNEVLPLELYAGSIVDRMPDLFNWLRLLDMNDDVIFVLMVIVAVINMVSSLLIGILERASMIGILKALGYANAGIRRVFLYNSAYLVGYGLLIGNAAALALYIFQTQTQFFALDPAIYYVAHVPMAIAWHEIALLNLAVTAISLLAMFVPAMLISRISPIRTIRFS